MRTIIRRPCRIPVVYILLLFLFVLPAVKDSHASEPDSGTSSGQSSSGGAESLSRSLADDGSYLFHSFYRDGIDLFKLPLRANEVTVTGVLVGTAILGTIPATIYGLDDPLRRNLGLVSTSCLVAARSPLALLVYLLPWSPRVRRGPESQVTRFSEPLASFVDSHAPAGH